MVHTATHHDAQTWYLRQPVPGIGQLLRLVRLDAIHQLDRCPRGQDVASSCRLVPCAREAAGTRSGTSGATIGNAHLQWAFSAAAVVGLRDHPAAHTLRTRREKNHRQGTALTIRAHPWARAVYDMFKRQTAFELATCLQGCGRGAGKLAASLDSPGMPLLLNARAGGHHCVAERSGASRAFSLSPPLAETPTPASLSTGGLASTSGWILARPRTCARTSRTQASL